MTYEIEWLDKEYTRAKVTKKSRFRPDRVAIAVLASTVPDSGFCWDWVHAGTNLSVRGERMKVYLASRGGTHGGTEAQAALSAARYSWLCGSGSDSDLGTENEHWMVVRSKKLACARLLAP